MTQDELREIYVEAYRIIEAAPPEFPKERMHFLLAAIKDMAKLALWEQPRLLDVPRKAEYK